MAAKLEIYKCEICGNVVEVLDGFDAPLVCCGEEMSLYEAKKTDEGKEKHVPECERADDGLNVQVGSTPHPMKDEHYIQWVELVDGDETRRVFLKPGQEPKASFCCVGENVKVREFCNVHGLWETQA